MKRKKTEDRRPMTEVNRYKDFYKKLKVRIKREVDDARQRSIQFQTVRLTILLHCKSKNYAAEYKEA